MFFNTPVTIYNEVVDAEICGISPNGTPKKCLVEIGGGKADIQPLNVSGSAQDFGETPQGRYVAFFTIDTPVTSSCIIEDDQGVRYMADGRPQRRTMLLPHIKMTLLEMG